MPGSASLEYRSSPQPAIVSALLARIAALPTSTSSAAGCRSIEQLVSGGHVLTQQRQCLLSIAPELRVPAFRCVPLEERYRFLVRVESEAPKKRVVPIDRVDA